MRVILWILLGIVALAGAALAWLALRSPDQQPAVDREGRGHAGAAGARRVPGPPRRRLPRLPFRLSRRSLRRSRSRPARRGRADFAFDKKLGVPGQSSRRRTSRRTGDGPRRLDRRRDPARDARGRRPQGRGALPDDAVPVLPRDERRGRAVDPGLPARPSSRSATRDAPRGSTFRSTCSIKFAPKPVTGPDRDARSEGHARLRQVPRHDRGLPRTATPRTTTRGSRSPARTSRAAGVLLGPWGRVVTANLTPDPDNYMGQATPRRVHRALQVLREPRRRERAGRAARAATR